MIQVHTSAVLMLALASGVGTRMNSRRPAGPPAPVPTCTFVGPIHSLNFSPGATTLNTFVTAADPDTRRFLIYVPSAYSAQHAPYPVVFMLHGTGQTAQNARNNTTWNQAAEVEEFIAVYPEALPYLLNDGTTRTKWHTDEVASHVVDPSELPLADDTVYLRELYNTLGAHLNIDCERVYATGFSNGGAFVKTKIHVDLADLFAATTSAGGIGLGGGVATQYYPANGFDFRPHFEVVGTQDDKKLENCILAGDLQPGDMLPRRVNDIVATPCMWDPLLLYGSALSLDVTSYTTIENQSFTQFLWSTPVLPGPGPREYRFRVLPGMEHEYPSGTNHPIDYVPIFYTWMSQYTR
jgi:predicted esterase